VRTAVALVVFAFAAGPVGPWYPPSAPSSAVAVTVTDPPHAVAPAPGMTTAVLDRPEGDDAVLVLERGDESIATVLVAISALPPPCRHPDAVFHIRDEDGAERLVCDPVATRIRARALQARFDHLADSAPDANGTG
jgi:hypothetical protein